MVTPPTYGDLIVDGLDEVIYHADKTSLSVSGAKKLLSPSCPAKFKWDLDNGQAPKRVFDFGHAAHRAVLGVGNEIEVFDFPDWRTKEAQRARDEARANGAVPLLADEAARVEGMAEAIRQHPIASALLDPAGGKPEQSAYWLDPEHEIRRRARFDWLPHSDGGQLVIPDYKTTQSSEPETFSRAVATYNYHMQAAWYCETATAIGLAEDVSMVFIAQEKTPPYVVTVFELDTEAMLLGKAANDRALRIYKECLETDTWPGYSDRIELLGLPVWAAYDEMETT